MKRLECELCGSTEFVKQDGYFVCQSCGCKYSVEEARKLMMEAPEQSKNTQNLGTYTIDNYLEMAASSKEAGNLSEAEAYSNKALELDIGNYKAWVIKGESTLWASTLQNSRVDEGVSYLAKAYSNAPDNEKNSLLERIKEQIESVVYAMLALRTDVFAKSPTEDQRDAFIDDISLLFNTVYTFPSSFAGEKLPLPKIRAGMAHLINNAAVNTWNDVVWTEYNGYFTDSENRANKEEWNTFLTGSDCCLSLLIEANTMSDNDDPDTIQRYKNLITIEKAVIESCSWDFNITERGKTWFKDWSLTDKAKSLRQRRITDYERRINEIEQSIAQKEEKEKALRRKQYWDNHPDEKAALEAEKESLSSQISVLEQNEEALINNNEITALKKEISTLQGRLATLGVFKGKEKKELSARIDSLEKQIKTAKDRIDLEKWEIEKRIKSLQDRMSAVNKELTADR